MNDYIKMIDHDEYKEALEALECGYLDTADIEQYMQAICESLKKQIPKKLAIKGRVTENGAIIGHYYCPTCEIYAVIHLYNGKYLKPNNCINCGQALDWSGEDE